MFAGNDKAWCILLVGDIDYIFNDQQISAGGVRLLIDAFCSLDILTT